MASLRPLVDDQLDRREVYARRRVQLTRTNGLSLLLSRGDPALFAKQKHRHPASSSTSLRSTIQSLTTPAVSC